MISKKQIKYIRSLHQKKYREQNKVFLIDGHKIVKEALNTVPERITHLLFTNDFQQIDLADNVRQKAIVLELSTTEFKELSTQKSPQGIMAVIKQPLYPELKKPKSDDLFLALDRIRDPGNLGTIIRTCDWFGIKNIICSPDSVECFNPKVVQASMGAIFRVDVHYIVLEEFFQQVKSISNTTLYGTSLTGKNIYKAKLNLPAILVMGNESEGLSRQLDKLVDEKLFIPNYSKAPDKTESLNVSLATGIIMAEFRRQLQ